MTRPISVGATVRDAYAFLGANFSGIIGVIWLPSYDFTEEGGGLVEPVLSVEKMTKWDPRAGVLGI